MPIYEYRCADCGHALEKIQKLADAPLTDCPACGHSTLKKQISAAGFRLKGSGWYETDFKQGGKKNLHGDAGASEPAAGAAKSESAKPVDSAAKPAAKATEGAAKPTEKKPAPKADAA
ncbi:MAG TPA: FmdB family zinc ribbon protein [Lamprocystis sp. (in: g-proteobacteria)]|nr:FmdB family zinc ribbon protein [Lamprocystis sp. (in: g-proteobacteria)]